MVRRFSILFALFTFALAANARADILFEGYFKILAGDEHIGYIISRYEFDNKKKRFQSTYFLKTGKGPTEVTESLKAVSDENLAPMSYEYTTVAGKDIKTIDAQFKNGQLNATVKAGGKTQKIQTKIPKGTFLSSFLVYLMMKSKEGLRSETKYEYKAIAEEDAAIHDGQALVGKQESHRGFQVFKILNTYKDNKFLSYVNERGEVLGTDAMAQGIKTELVATPQEATAQLPYSASILKTLFGSVPAGVGNVVAQAAKTKEDMKMAPPGGKQSGVPPGQGIIIKAQPNNDGQNSKEQTKGN